MYSVRAKYLKQTLVRPLAARELESNIEANGNHPSVIVWSIGNELSSRPGPVQGDYIRRAAGAAKASTRAARWAIAVAGYPSVGCQPRYAPLDVIGVNEYFGWYPGPGGQIADRTLLPDYLDQLRHCYPNKAIVVSEFGAEANRDGPVEEKGTYAFQQDFVNFHLSMYADQAVAVGRDLLGAAGVPGPAELGRQQPAPAPAVPREGPRHLRRRAEAGVRRRAADLPRDAADRAGAGDGRADAASCTGSAGLAPARGGRGGSRPWLSTSACSP